jgi:thiamine kinase-like enzyme
MEKMIFQPDTTLLKDHPAIRAWNGFNQTNQHVESVDSLKTIKGKSLHHKSSVFRLVGVERQEVAVIAKRSNWQNIQLERTIYQKILPHVPVSRVYCYGAIKDEMEELGWIFLEEAAGVIWLKEDPLHQRIAAQWLATFHVVTSKLKLAGQLPERGLAYYAGCLEQGVQTILKNLNNPALTQSHIATLEVILDHLAFTKSKWEKFRSYYKEMPRCIVHGDIKGKNIRVHLEDPEKKLSVLDWEFAGWAVPAVDIPTIDPQSYWSFIHGEWPRISLHDVEVMKTFGIILRSIFSIWAKSYGLAFEQIEKPMEKLKLFDSWMISALKKLDGHC